MPICHGMQQANQKMVYTSTPPNILKPSQGNYCAQKFGPIMLWPCRPGIICVRSGTVFQTKRSDIPCLTHCVASLRGTQPPSGQQTPSLFSSSRLSKGSSFLSLRPPAAISRRQVYEQTKIPSFSNISCSFK